LSLTNDCDDKLKFAGLKRG